MEVHKENVRDLVGGFVLEGESDDDSVTGTVGFDTAKKVSKKDLEGLEVHETSNG